MNDLLEGLLNCRRIMAFKEIILKGFSVLEIDFLF